MENCWFPGNSASVLNPPSLAAGDNRLLIPPLPPDPPDPDPSNPLSLARFPPLNSPAPKSPKNFRGPPRAPSQSSSGKASRSKPSAGKVVTAAPLTPVVSESSISGSGSQNTVHLALEKFKILPPKNSSPIQTNRASKPLLNPPPLAPLPLQTSSSVTVSSSQPSVVPSSSQPSVVPSTPPLNPVPPPSSSPSHQHPLPSHPLPKPPLVERLRKSQNKTLSRLAPVSLSETGRPSVLIPDSVFQKGAELHKDFIICYFNGRPPVFNHIQSILNQLWGKGKRVEIHTNPLSRSMLVRIPSDYLRQKILEKRVWYVGDSMFQAIQWTSSASIKTPPPLDSIQIWAHLTGIPLDLRHEEGLSLVAGLVGEPKETDDFTLNLVSLTLSHVKVAVDLTQPLPDVVEFTRESGEVVEVTVFYPWVPPTCAHCKELGHISKNCLQLPKQSKKPSPATQSKEKKASAAEFVPPSSQKVKKSAEPDPPVLPVLEKLLSDLSALSQAPAPSLSSSSQILPNPQSQPSPLSSFPLSSSSINLPSPPSSSPLPSSTSLPLLSPSNPQNQLVLFAKSPSHSSSPDPRPPLKRSRPSSSQQSFPSFTDQLNFFSKPPIKPPAPSVPPDPSPFHLSNPFTLLSPHGSSLLEETID